jgi:hypothetical protein
MRYYERRAKKLREKPKKKERKKDLRILFLFGPDLGNKSNVRMRSFIWVPVRIAPGHRNEEWNAVMWLMET